MNNEPSSPVCYADESEYTLMQPQPLRLLILGAGAIGGYMGVHLAKAGADVTFLVREQRLTELRDHGLNIHSPLGDIRLQPQLVSRADTTTDYDIILLTCKAYDLDSAIKTITPAVGKTTRVLPLLNGLAHLPVLDEHFGREKIMAGFAHLAVERRDNGNIHHLNDFHRLTYGSRHDSQETYAARLESLLRDTALETERHTCIEQALWDKFIFLTTLAGATCLFRGNIGEILRTDMGEQFILDLLDECIAVASASGFQPDDSKLADYRDLLTDRSAAYTASMLRDLQAGQRTEAEHILGDMFRRAERLGVNCDRLGTAYAYLQVYENNLYQSGVIPAEKPE